MPESGFAEHHPGWIPLEDVAVTTSNPQFFAGPYSSAIQITACELPRAIGYEDLIKVCGHAFSPLARVPPPETWSL